MLKIVCLLLSFLKFFSCQEEHWGVSDYLHEVDDSISSWLKDPSLNSKKEIFEMVGDYLETLQDFIEKIDLRRKTALTHGEILLKRKQPHYLEVPFPEDVLKMDYNWRGVDVDDFRRLLNETDLLWQDFEYSFTNMKKAVAEGEEVTSDKSEGKQYGEPSPRFFLASIEDNILAVINGGNLSGLAFTLMSCLKTYNKYLAEILVESKKESFGQLIMTKSIAQSGGPQILRHNFNYTYLRDTCNWSDIEILDLRNIVSDTMVLWQNFKRYAKIM